MSDTLIKVENVSKKFCRSLKKSLWYGMQDLGNELLGRRHGGNGELRPDEFWAVKDVSFELKRGECLGLIGRNGAGKTTLLRMLNGLIKPDAGRIEMRGRVGALIALGAGFNPILTGRENIYVNAAVLRLSKNAIEAKFEEIVEFAELGEFIDMPVQSYSSGMTMRLGFAVSTMLDPDILILDEVLAVGDVGFRHKCYHRINRVISHAAVILVSHNMDHIAQTSTKVAMMRRGLAEFYDDPTKGLTAYIQETTVSDIVWKDDCKVEKVYVPVRRAKVRILDSQVRYSGCLSVDVEIECTADVPDVVFSFTAINLSEQPVMCWHTSRYPRCLYLYRGIQHLRFHIDPLMLHDGDYYWNFLAGRRGSVEQFIWFMRGGFFSVISEYRPIGNVPYIPDSSRIELVMPKPDESHPTSP